MDQAGIDQLLRQAVALADPGRLQDALDKLMASTQVLSRDVMTTLLRVAIELPESDCLDVLLPYTDRDLFSAVCQLCLLHALGDEYDIDKDAKVNTIMARIMKYDVHVIERALCFKLYRIILKYVFDSNKEVEVLALKILLDIEEEDIYEQIAKACVQASSTRPEPYLRQLQRLSKRLIALEHKIVDPQSYQRLMSAAQHCADVQLKSQLEHLAAVIFAPPSS